MKIARSWSPLRNGRVPKSSPDDVLVGYVPVPPGGAGGPVDPSGLGGSSGLSPFGGVGGPVYPLGFGGAPPALTFASHLVAETPDKDDAPVI